MFILFLFVLLTVILLVILERNKINILKKLEFTFIISGSLMVLIGLLFKIIVKMNITFINIKAATEAIVYQFMIIGIIFYVCGIISYIGYEIIRKVYD